MIDKVKYSPFVGVTSYKSLPLDLEESIVVVWNKQIHLSPKTTMFLIFLDGA